MRGTLAVNGTMANATMTVNSGGTLAGTGTVGNVTWRAAAPSRPASGTPGRSMTVAGNLAFQSGALYVVPAQPDERFERQRLRDRNADRRQRAGGARPGQLRDPAVHHPARRRRPRRHHVQRSHAQRGQSSEFQHEAQLHADRRAAQPHGGNARRGHVASIRTSRTSRARSTISSTAAARCRRASRACSA